MQAGQKCPQCKKGRLMYDMRSGVASTGEDGPEYVEETILVCTNEDCDFQEYLSTEYCGVV